MKVNVSHSEGKEGVLFKKMWYRSEFTIEFSEEELHIIRENGLEDYIWIDVPHDDYTYDKKMENIYKTETPLKRIMPNKKNKPGGIRGAYLTQGKSKQFDALVQEALPKLKDFITSYGNAELRDHSFEL